MNSAKQLCKLTESLSAVKAQLTKQIVGLEKILTSLAKENGVSEDRLERLNMRLDVCKTAYKPKFRKGVHMHFVPSIRWFLACDEKETPYVGEVFFRLPERIRNYRKFALMTQTGPQAARLAGYGGSLNTMINKQVQELVWGDWPEFVQRYEAFVQNAVIIDTISDVSTQIVPNLKRCDLEYWHSPLLEPVFTFCNGILTSIGIEYFETMTYCQESDLPQYLDEVECCDGVASVMATYLTLVDALQLRQVVDGLCGLFSEEVGKSLLRGEDR